uniref:GPR180/TMEM145 transmembrane domain-containing protein n=1 Tax=Panagrolaimus sp. ES5 TaxID=591445 RepID=A0AC34FY71_9BILA
MESEYAASCGTMLKNFSQVAFEVKCLAGGRRSDMLRWAPCPKDKICEEEDKPKLIVPGYQFTFRIEEPVAPEYWYILLLSCTLNDKCNWTTSTRNYQIEYDIWLVNGNNAFSKQFSYEEQDIIHVYMFALFIYIALALGQLRATSLNRQSVLPRRQKLINTITPKSYLRTNTFDFLSNRGLVILRLVQGAWFFVEIKRTIKREPDDERIVFLVHFGAAYMVWFVYLLGLGVIAAFISEIWRLKIVLAISTFANFVAIACLVHLFWPTGSNRKFFVHDGNYHHHLERTSSTELEDFEKALICDDTDDDDVIDSKL